MTEAGGAEVVNLRRARKQRARAEGEKTATRNRAAHGVPPSLRRLAEAQERRRAVELEAHRREPPDEA